MLSQTSCCIYKLGKLVLHVLPEGADFTVAAGNLFDKTWRTARKLYKSTKVAKGKDISAVHCSAWVVAFKGFENTQSRTAGMPRCAYLAH